MGLQFEGKALGVFTEVDVVDTLVDEDFVLFGTVAASAEPVSRSVRIADKCIVSKSTVDVKHVSMERGASAQRRIYPIVTREALISALMKYRREALR